MLTSGNFLTMLARGSGSAASSDPQSRPASSPTSAREKSLFMTAFRLGRRAPASFDAAADQRFRSLVLLVESGQGPFDNRRQKAWLLPANRDWCRGRLSAAGVVLRVQLLHALAGDVGIYLRRGKVAVAQQHLHHPQVR